MRILHLSDLHLGRSLYKTDISSVQIKMCEEIKKFIKDKKIDAVLVSGDIYDTALSGAKAVEIWDRFTKMTVLECKLPLLVISGNHDSAERLSVCSDILEGAGLYIRGNLKDFEKPVNIGNADIYMLPFFERGHAESLLGKNFDSLESAFEEILDIIRARLDKSKINIVMAHTFTSGGVFSQSERCAEAISVGTINGISPDVFRGFDYLALGHIHKPQTVKCSDKNTLIRYSGTLLKYDFSESGAEKLFNVYDTETKTLETFPCPELIKLRCISGDFDRIKEAAKKLDGTELVKITLDGAGTPEISDMIRALIPNAVKIISSEIESDLSGKSEITDSDITNMDIIVLAQKYLKEYYGLDITDKQKEQLLSAKERYERGECRDTSQT